MKNLKKKEITHKNIEICQLTKEEIDTSKDKYAIIVECDGDKITNVSFWKHQALLELINGNLAKLSQMTMKRIGGMAGSILEKMGIAKPVYEIGVGK